MPNYLRIRTFSKLNLSKVLILLCLLWLCLPWGCTQPEREIVYGGTVDLEIVDSLVIPKVGNYFLGDISPSGEHLVFQDRSDYSFEIYHTSGEQVASFNKRGDVKGSFGIFNYSLPVFWDDHSIATFSALGIFVYDMNGDLQEKIQPPFQIVTRFITPMGHNLRLDGDRLIGNLQGRYDSLGTSYKYYQQPQLELIDLKTMDYSPIVQYDEDSRFHDKADLFPEFYSSISFFFVDDTLGVAYSNDPVLHRYKVSGKKVEKIDAIKLPVENFIWGEAKQGQERSPADLHRGSIPIVEKSGDLTLIGYRSGLTREKYESLTAGVEGGFAVLSQIANANNPMNYFSLYKGMLSSFETSSLPQLGALARIDQDGHAWFSANEAEIERDYTVFYKVKIKVGA